MIVTDPIADMLTRIRNAIGAKHEKVSIPTSKEKLAIAKILLEQGYILEYAQENKEKENNIVVTLILEIVVHAQVGCGFSNFEWLKLALLFARLSHYVYR